MLFRGRGRTAMTHHKLMARALNLRPGQRLGVGVAELRRIARAMAKPEWKRSMFMDSDLRDFISDCEEKWGVVFEDSEYGDGYDVVGC